jgi:hypothetical protein
VSSFVKYLSCAFFFLVECYVLVIDSAWNEKHKMYAYVSSYQSPRKRINVNVLRKYFEYWAKLKCQKVVLKIYVTVMKK